MQSNSTEVYAVGAHAQRWGLAADLAYMMHIMMAASTEPTSANSILLKTHLYLWE